MIPQSAPTYTILISKIPTTTTSSSTSTPLSLIIMILPCSTNSAILSFLSPLTDRLIVLALHDSIDIFLAHIVLQNKYNDLTCTREQDKHQVVKLAKSSFPPPLLTLITIDCRSSTVSSVAVCKYAASEVWHTETIWLKHHIAVDRILHDTTTDGKLLLPNRIGEEKLLTMQIWRLQCPPTSHSLLSRFSHSPLIRL